MHLLNNKVFVTDARGKHEDYRGSVFQRQFLPCNIGLDSQLNSLEWILLWCRRIIFFGINIPFHTMFQPKDTIRQAHINDEFSSTDVLSHIILHIEANVEKANCFQRSTAKSVQEQWHDSRRRYCKRDVPACGRWSETQQDKVGYFACKFTTHCVSDHTF